MFRWQIWRWLRLLLAMVNLQAAVDEIIATVNPDHIVVETTGVAEPDALVFDIQESLPRRCGWMGLSRWLMQTMVKYPQVGHTARMQIESPISFC